MRDTGATDQQGRFILGETLVGATNWAVHWLLERDHGIDGIVELTDGDGKPDGGRVALQVKSGPSYFKKPKKDRQGNVVGWWHPVPPRHRQYWLDQSLPVYVALVNLETRDWYFQRVTEQTCVRSGKSFRILVPVDNKVAQASSEWRQGAESYRAKTRNGHALLGKLLPPTCADAITRLAAVDAQLADMVAASLAGGEPELNVQFLLSAADTWLRDCPSLVFVAAGSFASEHELFGLAADALEHAARRSDVDDERRGVLLAFAGSCAAGVDEDRAEQLLTEARATGSELGTRRAELVRIIHDADLLASFRPEQWQNIKDAALAGQAALTAALHHQRFGRIDSAITEVGRSRDHQPQATRPMLLQADLLLSRASTSHAHPGDRAAALDLTRRARAQRSQWNGPTQSLLALEIKALALLSREAEMLAVIDSALADPQTLDVVLRDPVALAMITDIVVVFRRQDLADQLSQLLPDTSLARDALVYRRTIIDQPTLHPEGVEAGLALIARAVEDQDARLAVTLAMALAARKADVSSAVA